MMITEHLYGTLGEWKEKMIPKVQDSHYKFILRHCLEK